MELRIMPVRTAPMLRLIVYTFVMLAGSSSLSGTFFCVIITAADFDLRPIVVRPDALMALKAYSEVK
jgi:hypothetical protein